MTELCSGVAISMGNCNKSGTVGVPLVGNNVKVICPENNEELRYNEKGEICISAPTIMLGYQNNEAETKKVIEIDKNGVKWVHTGDLGYVDEDGYLYIIDRIKRMIIRPDGHNVFPAVIEQVLFCHDAVADCCVVGMKDINGSSGKWPAAHIVLKANYKEKKSMVISELQKLMQDKLPERDKAEKIFFHERLPLTSIGKIDYRALEKESENE